MELITKEDCLAIVDCLIQTRKKYVNLEKFTNLLFMGSIIYQKKNYVKHSILVSALYKNTRTAKCFLISLCRAKCYIKSLIFLHS